MNKIVSLTKVLIKNSFQKYNENNKNKNIVGKVILYILLGAYLMGIFAFLSYGLISTLKQANQESMFIGIFLLGLALLTIIQSIISSTNVFYFSKDIEYILPLPLKPKEILISKLNVILITEYIMEIIFAVTPITTYGIITLQGPMFYIISLLVLIVFPIIPILIATFIIMIIMSFSKRFKNKDRFRLIAPLIGIILAVIMSFSLSGTTNYSEEDLLNSLKQANSMVEMVSDNLPIIKPAINAIVNSSFVEFLKLLGITLILYIVFILIGNKIYFRGVIGNLSSGTKKGKEVKLKKIKTNSIGKSYIIKEFKVLLKNPIFFIQCVLPSVLMPIIFLGIFIVTLNTNNSQEALNEFKSVLGIYIETPIGLAIIISVTEFLTSMLYVAPTVISRDGQNAIFMKYIPISYYKQLIYKGIPNIFFGTITSTIVIAFIYILAKPSLLFLLTVFIINLILLILQTLLMELVDLRKPKLEWTTEYAVVKQNLNLLWPVVLNLLEIGIILIISILLNFTNYLLTAIILIVIHIIITYFVNKYMYKNQNELFNKIG
ncbi:MAG: putative ABC transporter permease subunit [Clostridia bacterium]